MFEHKLLVAKPILIDPVFSEKVVFVIKHDDGGAEGLILNGPVAGKLAYGEVSDFDEIPKDADSALSAMAEGKFPSVEISFGGPCRTPGFAMLHGYADLTSLVQEGEFVVGNSILFDQEQPCQIIMKGLYFGSPDTLTRIVMEGRLKENKFRFFSGISAWSAGQLEREVEAGAWDVKDAPEGIVFDTAAIQRLVKAEVQPPQKLHDLSALFQSLLKPSMN
jgi:putative transcriptional regulator